MRFCHRITGAVAALGVFITVGLARASSHREAPAISFDPVADNTDLWAWVSSDLSTLYIVAAYNPRHATSTRRVSMPECLFEKRADGIGLITLNRPEQMNATTPELSRLLAGYIAECDADPEVRCVALTGAGRAFCSGADVKRMNERNQAGVGEAGRGRYIACDLPEAPRL